MKPMILLAILFVVYYIFVLYVFYRLHLNMCSCTKLEKFKQMWQFNTVVLLASIFIIYNLRYIYKNIKSDMMGGSLMFKIQLIFICGYALTFFHDYAIISLFNIMKQENCPCQEDYRNYLEIMTYVKSSINALLLAIILYKMDGKLIKKAIKKVKKR